MRFFLHVPPEEVVAVAPTAWGVEDADGTWPLADEELEDGAGTTVPVLALLSEATRLDIGGPGNT